MPEVLPGLTVSDATLATLQEFTQALQRWTASINLVAPATLADAWSRHILDSAQLWPLAPPAARHWADLGSGGGLPGLVIAILARGTNLRVTLVESDRRKAAFLRDQVARHGLPARVEAERVEVLAPLAADVVSARALAPLDRLLPMVARHLAPGGVALLPKGRGWGSELQRMEPGGVFHVEHFPSATDPEARILRLSLTG